MQAEQTEDTTLRGLTNDGGFRVITARTTETVRGAIKAQKVSGLNAQYLGELITGAILFRETMAPSLRVQAILNAGDSGQLVADSRPDGTARGLVRLLGGHETVQLGDQSVLQMMRTLPNGKVHRGVVEVPTDGGISGGLMNYMQSSEQTVTMISVGIRMKDDEVLDAGGYVVQLLPELEDNLLMVMTERLKDFRAIGDLFDTFAATPEKLMSELLYGIEYTELDRSEVRFGCDCSRVRVIASLSTLPKADIESLLKEGTTLEMNCDYCSTEYRIQPEHLRGLLERS